jgi:hypothetical protein
MFLSQIACDRNKMAIPKFHLFPIIFEKAVSFQKIIQKFAFIREVR